MTADLTPGDRDPLQPLLVRMLGPGAEFRDGQREAIEAVLRGERTLVVQRTGWGKSIVYWMATRVLRDRGRGPTLVISPLLSLMRNQIDAAKRLGLRPATIHSGNREEWQAAREGLRSDSVDVLLVSPERLGNEEFATEVLPSITGGIGLFVVDEAHCISDWGHDFRPDYRRLRRIIAGLPPRTPLLATTATANDRVVADVVEQLGGDVRTVRGSLARSSLRLQTITLRDGAERLAWLAENLPAMPDSGIVYCLTVADTERVAEWLNQNGIMAAAYHARLTNEARIELERSLIDNRFKALVASTALGMGFDKPDLGFVVHYQRPGSVIAYYQQVGRAGRALENAYGILLSGREDDEINDFFIRNAFPPEADMRAVLAALESVETASLPVLEQRLNLRRSRIAHILKLLEVDSAVAHEGQRYFRTLNPWQPDTDRIERVTALRRSELAHMQAYMTHPGCLMTYLTAALDDPTLAPCGRCAPDLGGLLPTTPDPALVRRAVDFLRRSDRPIEPRRQWPQGAVPSLTGRMPLPNEPGRTLAVYGDAGWGRRVAEGKYREHRFGDDLVAAAAKLVSDRWRPDPAPTWVTAIPSLRHPALVGDYARRLADALGLPFHDVLAAAAVPPQKEMQNSAQQLRNVAASLRAIAECPAGPVLLVDDIVDSRWTLTYAGWLLRHHGAGPVHPIALATAAPQDDA
jgi:ATP-dependent DNA helicase RecQ